MGSALQRTAAFWPPLRRAYSWVERIAAVLDNKNEHKAPVVRRRFAGLLSTLQRALPDAGKYRVALAHFLKITRSHRPYLFACYSVEGLPRTNNDLEQLFGRFRYHERGATGRKVAGPSTVVRGRARIVAAIATSQQRYEGRELAPRSMGRWRQLRRELAGRQRPRTLGRRFRRDPADYLRKLEATIIKASLPP